MTPCLFLLSDHACPALLHPQLVWHLRWRDLLANPELLSELVQRWHAQPPGEAFWVLDLPDNQPAPLLDALRAPGLDLSPWLLWLPNDGQPDREAQMARAWAAGAWDVLDEAEPQAITRTLHRLLIQARAQSGPAARLRHLRSELQALRASLDNLPAPIFIKNAAGLYTECNQAFLDYLGLTREQVIGRTVYEVAPPAQAATYAEADRQLLAVGTRQIYEAQVRWADGNLREVMFHKAVYRDEFGRPAGQAGAMFDITERRQLEHRLRHLAGTDVLTGLHNRRSFIEQAGQRLRDACQRGQPMALLLLDVDHFKQVNDEHGHAAGDAMLCHLTQLVRATLRADDIFARVGGDEFAVVLDGPEHAASLAQRLPLLFDEHPLKLGERQLPCRISLGAALIRPELHTVDSALNQADLALYEAKRQGRNRAVLIDTHAADDAGPPLG
ncbi:diguanylate cyclase [Ideonella azotifigens]|uniref:Diguanylate cyclase n=2 Tax=Ideonella azotifigens TaxID=513160 RepID=A0ABP3VZR9_9BURK|nr:diguanylate cyclase [Ideonella azotifigens]MCD2343498.1 diguanylate cyclase [Ideonella azotifigens]